MSRTKRNIDKAECLLLLVGVIVFHTELVLLCVQVNPTFHFVNSIQ